jgi:hypothetical protein
LTQLDRAKQTARGDKVTPVPGHRTKRGFVRTRRQATALLIAGSLTGLAGCSDSTPAEEPKEIAPSSPASDAATPSAPSAVEARARKDVVAAYRGMIGERIKAYAKASLEDNKITDYATGKALRDVKHAVFINMQNGIIVKGEPRVSLSEDDVVLSLESLPQRATLRVCFDTHTWKPIDKTSGKSVAAPDQVKRYMITAKLQRQADQWRVTEERADKEQKC